MLLRTCMFRFVRDFQFLLYTDLFHNVVFDFFFYYWTIIMKKKKKKEKAFTFKISCFFKMFIELFDIFPTCVLSIQLAIILKKISVVSATALHAWRKTSYSWKKSISYIFPQTFFIHLSLFPLSSLFSLDFSSLSSKIFPSLGNTHVPAASTK